VIWRARRSAKVADVKVDKVVGFHKQFETDLAIAFARDGKLNG